MFNRKSSQASKKDNPLFSSTTSMKSFNLLKTCKNLAKKGTNKMTSEKGEDDRNESFNKGNYFVG